MLKDVNDKFRAGKAQKARDMFSWFKGKVFLKEQIPQDQQTGIEVTRPYTFSEQAIEGGPNKITINGVEFTDGEEVLVKYAFDYWQTGTVYYKKTLFETEGIPNWHILDFYYEIRPIDTMQAIKKKPEIDTA